MDLSRYDPEWIDAIGWLDPDDPLGAEAVHRAQLLIEADPETVEQIFTNRMTAFDPTKR